MKRIDKEISIRIINIEYYQARTPEAFPMARITVMIDEQNQLMCMVRREMLEDKSSLRRIIELEYAKFLLKKKQNSSPIQIGQYI